MKDTAVVPHDQADRAPAPRQAIHEELADRLLDRGLRGI